MSAQGVYVLILIVGMIAILIKDRMRPGMTLFTIVILMMASGVIDSQEALSGFSNRGMITVGLLYLVSEGVSRSGALNRIAALMLPQKKGSMSNMLSRMLIPVSALSAFLNNTPIVIIFAPMFKRWAEIMNVPSKKILIPLSYATILGGMCTVIGTTTNLVVDGMMISETGYGMPLFEIGKVGFPIAIVGLLYIIFASRYLLPGNPKQTANHTDIPKEYYYDVTVHPGSKFIGKKICNGQLEHLNDMRVTSLICQNKVIAADSKELVISENDKLVLAGTSKGLNRLMMTSDLSLNCLHNCDDSFRDAATKQVEAVLAPRFPGIGKTLGEFDFYRHYGAIVMSLHRNGERITQGLNKIKLTEGDNLVLLTDDTFMQAWGESSVFYLLSETGEIKKPAPSRKRTIALILTGIMILGAAVGDKINLPWNFKIDMLSMAALTAIIMAWSNIFPAKKYTKFISW
ncbi:MAG: SLC13 family permease, partial [Bacteroidales bacterium]